MHRLLVILGSTRPGRVGLPVAEWFRRRATAHGRFEVDFADLATIPLPLLDEPNHPKLAKYLHRHTHDWSARVMPADAVVFITPEYNHSISAVLKNALDYLHREWEYKPAGIVSYGGVSGGTRAGEALRQITSTLKMVPLWEAVAIPFVQKLLDAQGRFEGGADFDVAAQAMLEELHRWSTALRTLRAPQERNP